MVYNFFDKKSARLTDKSGKSGTVNMEKKWAISWRDTQTVINKVKKEEFILHLKTIFRLLI